MSKRVSEARAEAIGGRFDLPYIPETIRMGQMPLMAVHGAMGPGAVQGGRQAAFDDRNLDRKSAPNSAQLDQNWAKMPGKPPPLLQLGPVVPNLDYGGG